MRPSRSASTQVLSTGSASDTAYDSGWRSVVPNSFTATNREAISRAAPVKLSLRWRILLTLVPMLLLVLVLGSVGAVLLHRLGNSIDAILRENYRSVIYMERLNEAVERIDSSF